MTRHACQKTIIAPLLHSLSECHLRLIALLCVPLRAWCLYNIAAIPPNARSQGIQWLLKWGRFPLPTEKMSIIDLWSAN